MLRRHAPDHASHKPSPFSLHLRISDNPGIPKFTPALITRKSHLLSLARLFASSPTRVLSFSSIATSLSIPASEVDEIIFDGSAAGLFVARISQPEQNVKVVSVSRAATINGGNGGKGKGFEWDLLQARLGEWKKAVGEARKVVRDAEEVARAPVREERQQGQGQGQGQKGGYKGKEKKEGQQGEEVVA